MKEIKELFLESIKNRHAFLEAKKQEFINAPSDRKRKELTVELIQLEPSHLGEYWILDQVIKMMRNREENIDFLQAAFIARGNRDEITEKQRADMAQNAFLWLKVKNRQEKNALQIDAIREIVTNSDDDTLPEDAESALKQRLKRYRKTLDSRDLPFPYYGKDFMEFDRGNENHRIEFYLKNKPGQIEGSSVFGDMTYTIPLKPQKNNPSFF